MKTNEILSRLYTSKAIAEWKAAEDFLDQSANDLEAAIETIKATKLNGLSPNDAEHLIYLVKRLSFEATSQPIDHKETK